MDTENQTNTGINFLNDSFCYSSPTFIVHTYSYYINGPILLITAAIGFIGNVLCLCACARSRRPRQINYYLLALSLWDLCLVTGSFFLYSLPYLLYGRVVTEGNYVLVYPFIYTLACAFHTGSIWAVIASGVDRYFALCHPIMHKIYTCPRRTTLILGVLATLAILYNLPHFLELELSSCFDAVRHAWIPVIQGSPLRADPAYWLWYKVVGGLLFFSLGPLTILIYLSIKVWWAVRRLTKDVLIETKIIAIPPVGAKKGLITAPSLAKIAISISSPNISKPKVSERRVLRRHSTVNTIVQESQYTLNVMLLTVIVKFVVCHSLPTALDVCEALMPAANFNSTLVSNLVATSNLLVVCNSSINIFIYCFSSRRFRHDLINLLAIFSKRFAASRKSEVIIRPPISSEYNRTPSLLRAPVRVDNRRETITVL